MRLVEHVKDLHDLGGIFQFTVKLKNLKTQGQVLGHLTGMLLIDCTLEKPPLPLAGVRGFRPSGVPQGTWPNFHPEGPEVDCLRQVDC